MFLDQGQEFTRFCNGCLVHCLSICFGSFCKPPNWVYGICIKCSTAFGRISSQRPAFFSLTMLLRSTITGLQKNENDKGVYHFRCKDMLLYLQSGSSIVRAAMVFSILERTSVSEPLSVTTWIYLQVISRY